MSVIRTTTNDSCLVHLFFGVLAFVQLLPGPKEALADSLSKYLLLCSPVQYQHIFKEMVADPT